MALSPQERSRRMRLNMLMAMSYAVAGRSAAFTPLSLFSAGEVGAWYDPSDFSTMFQDASGTTPVTAVEQPVGLILDKSKGLALGSELVSNGTFDSTTIGWTAVNTPTLTVGSNGVAIQNNGTTSGLLYQAVSTVVGRSYKITATIVYGGAGFARVAAYASVPTAIFGGFIDVSSSGQFSCVFTASATTTYITIGNRNDNNATNTFDNISVKELAGNHASQTTSTSRPVLSARVNLFTYSEQFNNGAWAATAANITANATTDPLGGNTADLVYETTATSSHKLDRQAIIPDPKTTNMTFSICAKAAGRRYLLLSTEWGANGIGAAFDLQTGVVTQTNVGGTGSLASSSITYLGNGWYRCTIIGYIGTNGSNAVVISLSDTGTPGAFGRSYTGDGASGIYLWGADLRVTNVGASLPVYQRVGAATAGSSSAAGTGDYDTTGFPYYLSFDGTDDSLATAAIDFSATDKMSVFAGVRKLNDSNIGIVAELSATLGANAGSFYLAAPETTGASGNFTFKTRGSINPGTFASSGTQLAPVTAVISGIGDIPSDLATIRYNGAATAYSADQGTGNFGSYPLYIGRRGGSTLPFNGRLYSLIIRGASSTLTEITNTETWVNSKTKAF